VTGMTMLRLDYQRSMNPFPVAGMLLLLLALGALSLTGLHYYRLSVQMSDWQASLNKLEHAMHRQMQDKPKPRAAPELMQEIGHANEILRQLSLPWEKLFQAVEASVSQDVTLLEMEPDTGKQIVRISCEAKNITAMLNYIRALEKQPELAGIYLQSHQIQEHDREKPVRFSLVAAWRETP